MWFTGTFFLKVDKEDTAKANTMKKQFETKHNSQLHLKIRHDYF